MATGLPPHGGGLGDRPVHGAQQLQADVAGHRARVGGRGARACAAPARCTVIGYALALVEVVGRVAGGRRAARLAEPLDELVHVVGGRRGRAPRVVLAAAEQHVEADAGEGGAAGVVRRRRGGRARAGSRASSRPPAGRSPPSGRPDVGVGAAHQRGVGRRAVEPEAARAQVAQPARRGRAPAAAAGGRRPPGRSLHRARDRGSRARRRPARLRPCRRGSGKRKRWASSRAPRGRSSRGSRRTPGCRACGPKRLRAALQRRGHPRLRPAATAEDAADQRGDRRGVGRLPVAAASGRARRTRRASSSGRCAPGRCRVDAGHVSSEVLLDRAPSAPAPAAGRVDHPLQLGLGVVGHLQLLDVHLHRSRCSRPAPTSSVSSPRAVCRRTSIWNSRARALA